MVGPCYPACPVGTQQNTEKIGATPVIVPNVSGNNPEKENDTKRTTPNPLPVSNTNYQTVSSNVDVQKPIHILGPGNSMPIHVEFQLTQGKQWDPVALGF